MSIRLSQNIGMFWNTTIVVLNSFKNIWKVSRNKKKNEFFWFFRPAPTQILQLSLREWKLVKNWSFSRFSTENQVLLSSHNLYYKKLVGLKKKSLKKLGPIRFYGHFSEKFWEKKIGKKIFGPKKKFFESCYFIFKGPSTTTFLSP